MVPIVTIQFTRTYVSSVVSEISFACTLLRCAVKFTSILRFNLHLKSTSNGFSSDLCVSVIAVQNVRQFLYVLILLIAGYVGCYVNTDFIATEIYFIGGSYNCIFYGSSRNGLMKINNWCRHCFGYRRVFSCKFVAIKIALTFTIIHSM